MWTFDVFETCLVRRQTFNSDVFRRVAERFEDKLLGSLGRDYKDVFVEARVEAERLSLEICGFEETTLSEIWLKLSELIPVLDQDIGQRIELEEEEKSLVINPVALELVNDGRRRHGKVLFISDTYLPSVFLEEQLTKNGFYQLGDVVYASSSHRATKRSGRLYSLVLQDTRIPAADITHHGNDYKSDVLSAKRTGLRAKYITNGNLSSYERELALRLERLNSEKVSSIIGVMRAARLTREFALSAPQGTLVTSFIFPFLWVFASWTLRRAALDGVSRLYFFSRDCYGLYRVAKILSSRLGLDIDCRYLRVSRQSLVLPSVTEISLRAMPWLKRHWESGKLEQILGKLEIDTRDLDKFFGELTSRQQRYIYLDSEAKLADFFSLLQKEPLSTLLKQRIDSRRAAATAYLEQEGLLEDIKIAVVDIGWFQSCHDALNKILMLGGRKSRVGAYYLGLVGRRGAYMPENPAQSMFHFPPPDRRSSYGGPEVFRRASLLEHILNCAPHGSVCGYKSNGQSGSYVSIELPITEDELLVKEQLVSQVEGLTDLFVGNLELSDSESREVLDALIRTVLVSPKKEWASSLQKIMVSDDQNNQDKSPLTRPLNSFDVVVLIISKLPFFLHIPRKRRTWLELDLASSGLAVQYAYNAVLRSLIFARNCFKRAQSYLKIL